MELDTKLKVLVAFYIEYQKDVPEPAKNISAKTLGLEDKVFYIALDKLKHEGLLQDLKLTTWQYGYPYPDSAEYDYAKPTKKAIELIENNIFSFWEWQTSTEKIKEINDKLGLNPGEVRSGAIMFEGLREILATIIKFAKIRRITDEKIDGDDGELAERNLQRCLEGLSFEQIKTIACMMCLGRDEDFDEEDSLEERYKKFREAMDRLGWDDKEIGISMILEKIPLDTYLENGLKILKINY